MNKPKPKIKLSYIW